MYTFLPRAGIFCKSYVCCRLLWVRVCSCPAVSRKLCLFVAIPHVWLWHSFCTLCLRELWPLEKGLCWRCPTWDWMFCSLFISTVQWVLVLCDNHHMLQPRKKEDIILFQYLELFLNEGRKNLSKMISSDLRQMFLFCVFNVYTIVGTCQLTTDKCCTGRPVTQEVDGVSDLLGSLKRDCRSRVHLQHWSTCSLQTGCMWCAGRNVWLSYPEKLSIFDPIFFPYLNEYQ